MSSGGVIVTLETDPTWRDKYGIYPLVLIEFAVTHWAFSLICLAMGIIILLFAPILRPFNQSKAPKSTSSPVDQKSAGTRDSKSLPLFS